METTGGRGLARNLSSHPQKRRGSGMGELTPRVRGTNKEVNVRRRRSFGRCGAPKTEVTDTHHDQSFATNVDRREEVRQELRMHTLTVRPVLFRRRCGEWKCGTTVTWRQGEARRDLEVVCLLPLSQVFGCGAFLFLC